MIEQFGMGIDICNINKFKKKPFKDNERFYKKFFSTSEVNYCIKFKNHHEKFAAKFAIKEALIKSINEKINFQDIETIHQNSKPKIILKSSKKYNFLVSLSHENDYAVAVVISEKIK
tara:strand:+ start:702 stop:1052 length:351 start_codon:yes stop_codon:yes gene_type:complete